MGRVFAEGFPRDIRQGLSRRIEMLSTGRRITSLLFVTGVTNGSEVM